MKFYHLRVSIIGIPRVYRIIAASENCTFDDLHESIFDAFDRFDPHLYSFYITRSDTKNISSIWQAPEITCPQNVENGVGSGNHRMNTFNTTIADVKLAQKDVFHYLFDFGDSWWHRIRVQSVTEMTAVGKQIELIKSVGESPPQYAEYDD